MYSELTSLRRLRIDLRLSNATEIAQTLDAVAAHFPNTPNLRELCFSGDGEDTVPGLLGQLLVKAPASITTLEFTELRWSIEDDDENMLKRFSSLERVVFRLDRPQSERLPGSENSVNTLPGPLLVQWSGDAVRADDPQVARTIRALTAICHHSVRSLFLHGEVTSLVALGQLQWPQLRHLTLVGSPLLDGVNRTQLTHLLSSAPNLEFLKTRFARPTGIHSLASSGPSHIISPSEDPSSLAPLTRLRQLSISNPLQEDRIWSLIPPSLTSLSLLCHPHYACYGASEAKSFFDMKPLPHQELLHILRCFQTAHLTRLSISFWAAAGDQAVCEYLAEACPSLQVLELHHNSQEMYLDDLVGVLKPSNVP